MDWARRLFRDIRRREFGVAAGSLLDLSGNATRRMLDTGDHARWRPVRTAEEAFARDREVIRRDLRAVAARNDDPSGESAAALAHLERHLDGIYGALNEVARASRQA